MSDTPQRTNGDANPSSQEGTHEAGRTDGLAEDLAVAARSEASTELVARPSYLAIVNPAAGGGRCGSRYQAALDSLRARGLHIEQVTTTAAGEAVALARDAWDRGVRRFIAVGGDGTAHEVVNGLMPRLLTAGPDAADRTSLAILPLGTGNSFLRDFTDDGVASTTAGLLEGRARPIDIVELSHDEGVVYSTNIIGVGFVAIVNGLRQRRFRAFGEFGYVLATLSTLASLTAKAYPMRFDGGAQDATPVTFYSLCNSKFTGGSMRMAPDADTADGRVDVIRVGALSRVGLLRAFPRVFKGTHTALDVVDAFTAATIDFGFDRATDVMVDGEALWVRPTTLRVIGGALDLVV